MIHKNAIEFLQKRFPIAPVMNTERILGDESGNEVKRIYPMIAQDPRLGIKQRAIAIENMGDFGELEIIATELSAIFEFMDGDIIVIADNVKNPTGQEISSTQMTFAPRVIFYTNKLCIPYESAIAVFNANNMLIDIVDESQIHQTLFISYGGPDLDQVVKINNAIKAKGVKTWFFPDDAVPGQKLHRTMHDGINMYDRVLLICSKDSLSRMGVLNEIERVLEREAQEGGVDILIPISLDDYVSSDWAPDRPDLANQIRTRVITMVDPKSNEFSNEINKIVNTLKK